MPQKSLVGLIAAGVMGPIASLSKNNWQLVMIDPGRVSHRAGPPKVDLAALLGHQNQKAPGDPELFALNNS